MDYKLELVLIPVADVDRAKKFYLENAPTSPTQTATSGSCKRSTAARADDGSFGPA